jgi:single-stranded DNA-specific DHH superfamily exonuclease
MRFEVNGKLFDNDKDAREYENELNKKEEERKKKEADRDKRVKELQSAYDNFYELYNKFISDYKSIPNVKQKGIYSPIYTSPNVWKLLF